MSHTDVASVFFFFLEFDKQGSDLSTVMLKLVDTASSCSLIVKMAQLFIVFKLVPLNIQIVI